MPAMYDKCDVCGCGCEHGDRYCDRCWEEVSCEDTPSDYEPTEQDLLDMEVAFRLSDSEIIEILESMLDNPF